MTILDRILPKARGKRKWAAIGLTILIATPLTVWGVYGIGEYGIALFVLVPLLIGTSSTLLYGYKQDLKRGEAHQISQMTLGLFLLGCILFALEGFICVFMAAPFAFLLSGLGTLIGYAISRRYPDRTLSTILLLVVLVPFTGFIEKDSKAEVEPVRTEVVIDASPETVWKHVIEFPEIEEPEGLLFNLGIAYPVDARIDGKGEGAVRHCNFNTGSFVEPITVWREPELLKFKVAKQPKPMEELSFWDIEPPHMEGYFNSKKGEFRLRELPNGKTKLIGTTWYSHDIKPDLYWRLWSDWIIHRIHQRVLEHIKANAEEKGGKG